MVHDSRLLPEGQNFQYRPKNTSILTAAFIHLFTIIAVKRPHQANGRRCQRTNIAQWLRIVAKFGKMQTNHATVLLVLMAGGCVIGEQRRPRSNDYGDHSTPAASGRRQAIRCRHTGTRCDASQLTPLRLKPTFADHLLLAGRAIYDSAPVVRAMLYRATVISERS